MKAIIQSYETQNSKITELEIKLRGQNMRHEKEMKAMEERYQSKLNEMNKNMNYFQNSAKLKNAKNRYIEEEEEINHENVIYQ